MTGSSSAGNPDGAALPADHPLGPATPVPPREKEADRAAGKATGDGPAPAVSGDTRDPATDGSGAGRAGGGRPDTGAAGSAGDGRPVADRREHVLDPSAGSADHPATGIREEQGTHEAGAVPAAFDGEGSPGDPGHRRPEDAAAEPDAWDSEERPS